MVYHSVVVSRPRAHNYAFVIVVMHATKLSEVMSCRSVLHHLLPAATSSHCVTRGDAATYKYMYVMLNIFRVLQ